MPHFHDLESIINAVADPIFVKDRQHRWVLLNDAYCRFMGFERHQLIGKSDYDFFPRAEAAVFWNKDEYVFETGAEDTNDEDFTDCAGATHSITTKKSLYVCPSGEKYIVGCIRDLTNLKRTQQELQRARDCLEALVCERTAELAAANEALRQQIAENERTSDHLRQSQKMEAIGRLAGGVAHDFNNLLNIIIGYASLIQEGSGTDAKLQENAGRIATAAEKAACLTRQLLAFSRKQVLQPEVLAVDDILEIMAKMLPSLLGEDVDLAVWPRANSGYVRADRGQVEQVIMNLVVNARDAMRQGGMLTVGTATLNLTDDDEVSRDDVPPGHYVLLTVSDTGEGMDAETQAHIFEPFFTTKGPDEGTGMGLATVYAIVNQSGGYIRVHSELGQGSTFKIYLPRIIDAAPAPAMTQVADDDWRGSETILLVEDQKDLRGLLREVLHARGYTVIEADTGVRAIELANRYAAAIHLLVTDVVMPGMRGWELARRLSAMRPAMKILYISGHTDTDLIHEGALVAGEMLLEKPFKPEIFLVKVREMLWAQNQNDCREAKAG